MFFGALEGVCIRCGWVDERQDVFMVMRTCGLIEKVVLVGSSVRSWFVTPLAKKIHPG